MSYFICGLGNSFKVLQIWIWCIEDTYVYNRFSDLRNLFLLFLEQNEYDIRNVI